MWLDGAMQDALTLMFMPVLLFIRYFMAVPSILFSTSESQKLSALLFFQFIYTKVGVEQICHFST
jgi:hypothetical protein